jgi:hypothetical protein
MIRKTKMKKMEGIWNKRKRKTGKKLRIKFKMNLKIEISKKMLEKRMINLHRQMN